MLQTRVLLLQPYVSVCAPRKHLSEPAVRNNLRRSTRLTPGLPHSPRRRGGGLNGGSVPAHAAACPVVSADKMWVLGWGWGWSKMFTRVLGGMKGKWERPAASRGSLVPVIFVSVEHLFCIAKSESLKISIYFFLPQAQIKEQLQSCRTVRMPFSIMRQKKVYIYSRA